jgi:predicted nucleic acid-binding protein
MILCDAGVMLCLVDRKQSQHLAYRDLVLRLNKPLTTTWCCLTEAMYLAYKRGGWVAQKQLGQMLLNNALLIYEVKQQYSMRILDLMERYHERPMDLADATLVLAAENLGYRQILTTDSDFLFYRIHNIDSFDVINPL